MKYALYAASAAVVLAAVFLPVNMGVFVGQNPPSAELETQTDDRPPVIVKVTPIELGSSAKTWKFKLAFTTHSGSLNEDPAKVAVLSNDKGVAFRPIAWKGPGPGGHHISGVLVFKAIEPAPRSVELKVKGVGGVRERLFKWNIE